MTEAPQAETPQWVFRVRGFQARTAIAIRGRDQVLGQRSHLPEITGQDETSAQAFTVLARDQEKWIPVFRPITRQHINDDHVYHIRMSHPNVIVI